MIAHLHTLKANAKNQDSLFVSIECQCLHIKHMLHDHVQTPMQQELSLSLSYQDDQSSSYFLSSPM